MAQHPSNPSRTIAGGYVLVNFEALLAAWTSYRSKQLSLLDLRVYLALHEVQHRRRARASARTWHAGQQQTYMRRTVDELQCLTGCRRSSRIHAALQRLGGLGLVERAAGVVELPTGRIVLPRELGTPARCSAEQLAPRSWLPFPRRLLRFLAGGGSAASIAVATAYVARCIYRQADGGYSGAGCGSVDLIAGVFGLHARTVKAARQALVSLTWLRRQTVARWREQRYGAYYAVDLNWVAPDRSGSPRAASPDREIAPPLRPGPLSDLKNQNPRPRGVGCEKTRPTTSTPRLQRLDVADLQRPLRVAALHRQAVAAGWITAGEADRLRVFAAAHHARRVGTHNPPGLFVATVRAQRWHVLTLADEEWARRALQHIAVQSSSELGQAAQRNSSVTELVASVAGALSWDSPSERAKARTADAVRKKNMACWEQPAVSSSTAMTSRASISESTLSANAA